MEETNNQSSSLVPALSSVLKNSINDEKITILVSNLMEVILLCHPNNVIAFIQRYFEDETGIVSSSLYPSQLNNNNMHMNIIKASHACHILPFLILKPIEFRKNASVIFCNHCTIKDSIDKKSFKVIYMTMKSDHYNPITIIDKITDFITSTDKLNAIEEFGEFIIDINNNNNNNDRIKVIENLCPNGIKGIKFDSFIAYIRLLIGCFYATQWIREIFNEYFNLNTDSQQPSILNKWKNNESQKIDDINNLIAIIKRYLFYYI